ncbi:MAG TPA: RIP metalloprotease RseP [Gemmatimonadota bacterium]|nr:RIP metalloprotease RseP [Gemmatimonadota bacterium]
MQTLIITIIVLGVLVFVHELGHFVTAKWAGVGVPRFSIGLGPRVVGVKVGETDYCISAIPFGGYVKMTGMEGEEAFEGLEGGEAESAEAASPEKRFENKSVPWRLAILSAGVLMNFLLGWVIYVSLAWHDGIPTVNGTAVARVDSTIAAAHPELAALVGETIQMVEGRGVANWQELTEGILEAEDGALEIELTSGRSLTLSVTDAGDREAVAYALVPLVPAVIDEVQEGSPAARGGIQPGDRIVSIDGIETSSFDRVTEVVHARPDQILPVVVERAVDGTTRELTLTVETGVEKAPRPTDAKFVDVGMLGVVRETEHIRLSPVEALVVGTEAAGRASMLILSGLHDIVTGGVSLKAVGGPVAIGQLTGHFARQGMSSLLGWVALFSINLAILNLLPIPVLDGGHILFLGIEATRGRPLSTTQKLRLSQVGLAFLVLLMAWAFTADILRVVGF